MSELQTTKWMLLLVTAFLFALISLATGSNVIGKERATTFHLDNGLQVVVIEDHRLPVVTHMIWYRVGAADDPAGSSGIAHFFEHLMFKSTDNLKSGDFSRIISRIGGKDNATTTHDATFYFQRVAKDRLRTVMELEADRMVNLKLTEAEVNIERDVVREERRSNLESDPVKLLNEQLSATLFLNHPYGRPTLGWAHEIVRLSQSDASNVYRRFYAPNNAILVVAGDVTPKEVRKLAIATYGKNKSNPHLKERMRPGEPEPLAARRLVLEDPRAARPMVFRFYLTPSYATAKPGEAESIDLLARIIGHGDTSRLFKSLVQEKKLAVDTGATFFGSGRDYGRIVIYALGGQDADLDDIERAIDDVLNDVAENGVTQSELDRVQAGFEAQFIFESDDQLALARRYGEGLITGRTVADIDGWLQQMATVELAEIKKVASIYLAKARSVTGFLKRKVPGNGSRSAASSGTTKQ